MILKNFIEIIPDPVHKYIPITSIEQRLLNTSALQRLLHIRQMGLTYMVFPGANHTRYEHSLGVMHIADLLASNLKIDKDHIGLEEHWQKIRIAALLHDLGHAPLSHTLEEVLLRNPDYIPDEMKNSYSHEAYTYKLITQEDGEISKILRSVYFDPVEIANIAIGKSPAPWVELVSGELDADRIDYILRDLYHAGIPMSAIHLQKLAANISIVSSTEDNELTEKICFDYSAISALEGVLASRYHLITTLQNDPSNRILTRMVIHAIEKSLENYSKYHTIEDIHNLVNKFHCDWDDSKLLKFIMSYTEIESIPKFFEKKENLTSTKMGRWDIYKTLDFWNVRPKTNYFLHKIAAHPEKIRKFELNLRKELGLLDDERNKLYVDIATVNPPKLMARIADENSIWNYRFLLDYSPILHGLYQSSIQGLKVHLMRKSMSNFNYSDKEIQQAINNAILTTTKEFYGSKSLDLSDFVLMVAYCVNDYDNNGLNLNAWWKGDWSFSSFIYRLWISLTEKYPYLINILPFEIKKTPALQSIDKTLSNLASIGLLNASETIIVYENSNHWRFEKRISKWGRNTTSTIANLGMKELLDDISSLVREISLSYEETDAKQKLSLLEEKRNQLTQKLQENNQSIFDNEEYQQIRKEIAEQRKRLSIKIF